jgi:phosphomannomutase
MATIFKAYDVRGLYGEQIDGDTAEAIGRAERAMLAVMGRGEALHDQTSYAEHVAALDRGEQSGLAFKVDA